MKIPEWPACPRAGKRVVGRAQLRAQEIVLRVPIAKEAAEVHSEYDARIAGDELRGAGHPSLARIITRTTTIAPQVALSVQRGQPVRSDRIRRAEESREIAPPIGREGFAGAEAEI